MSEAAPSKPNRRQQLLQESGGLVWDVSCSTCLPMYRADLTATCPAGHFLPTDRVGHWGLPSGQTVGKDVTDFFDVAPQLAQARSWTLLETPNSHAQLLAR